MNGVSQERHYLRQELSESGFPKAYIRVLGTMSGLEYRSRDLARPAKRLLNAQLEGFRKSAVIILLSDEYNEVETEEQAEKLIKEHRSRFLKAIDLDEKDKESPV
ncbi:MULTISPECIES: hypothetical protein [Streptomyces]|uniref:Uncharacterized protein n=2 Tax=Streptomyces TaxID=1883 RepID=A0ABV9IS74_9ACTN